jgi:SAM-dependent methyltransferase
VSLSSRAQPQGLLGDTPARDYARKLRLFNAFAEPELRRAVASLELTAGMRVLDAGCGAGCTLPWLTAAVQPHGLVIGLDLAAAHVRSARSLVSAASLVLQADLLQMPVRERSIDLVWSVNTVNHLHDRSAGVRALTALVRAGGRIALGQSSFLPDMYFAWDARLERVTNEAVRSYYRDRYLLREQDLAGVRNLVGTLRRAGLRHLRVHTFPIERISPVSVADEEYLLEAIFVGTWGERLQPYLAPEDYAELKELCDPRSRAYALRREDFHFLQTFTLAVGEAP